MRNNKKYILNQLSLLTFAKASIILAFVIGLLIVMEWIAGIPLLNKFLSAYSPMKLTTSLFLVMSSLSLWLFLWQDSWGNKFLRITGGIIILVSLLTLLTYLDGNVDHQKETWLFNFFFQSDSRMAFITSLIFLFLGVIYILFSNNSRTQDNIAHVLFFPAASLSYFSMISYVLGVSDIFKIEGINIAPLTSFSLFLLCMVVLFLKSDTWLMRILSGPGLGSITSRRLLPWLLVLPVVIAWARIKGEQDDYFPSEVGVILVAITYTITYLLLVWWNGLYVNRIDTKRRQAHEVSDFQAQLLSQINEAVISTDANFMITYFNQGAERIFGWTKEEAVGKNLEELLKPKFEGSSFEEERVKLLNENYWIGEVQFIRKGGTYLFVDVSTKVLKNDNGTIIGQLVVSRDITERKRAEKALQKNEILLKSVLDNVDSGVAMIDESGSFSLFNPLFLKLFGISEGSTLKNVNDQDWAKWQVYDPDGNLLKVDNHPVRKAALTGKRVEHQQVGVKLPSGGELIWMLVSAEPILKEDETIEKIICTYHDITQLKLAEEVLAFQSQLLSEVNDAVFSSDSNSTITYWNQAAERMFGWTKEEALGTISGELLKPKTDVSTLEEVRSKLQNEEYWIGEGQYMRKDGTYFFVEVNSKTLKDANGKYVGQIVVVRDITERKRAEADLIEAKEKAEESDHLKSSFLANMSHELRTPLNSIIGFSELLADPDFEPNEKSRYAQIINTSGNSLLSLINDIMDISKIEAGQVQVINSLFSVNRLMTELHIEYSFKGIQKEIEIILDPLNPVEEVFIESDQTKIRQILVNLVGNAIKFTEKGFVRLGIRITGNFIEFHVKDTGIGIPADFQTRIFERFSQVESFDSRKYGGTGLGLAISKSLAELLGGRIWMESKQGEGTTFYFTVPINH